MKKTINTIKNNPRVLLVFGAAMLLMTFGLSAITLLSLGSTAGPAMLDYSIIVSLFRHFLGYIGILLLFVIVASTLIWPALGNYVYEMCSGGVEGGWYMRGLKKSLWKVPVLALIIITVTVVGSLLIGLLLNFLIRSVFIGLLLNIALALTFAVYSIIALTAVFAEDEFSYALGNVFSLGSHYFFRLLGVILLAYTPGFLVGLLFSYIRMSTGFTIDSFSAMYFITLAVNTIYGVIVTVFILTYSMHRYIDEKSIYYPSADAETKAVD